MNKNIFIFFLLFSIIVTTSLVSASICPVGVFPCDPLVQFQNPSTITLTGNGSVTTVNGTIGNCPDGYAVQNITATTIQCILMPSAGTGNSSWNQSLADVLYCHADGTNCVSGVNLFTSLNSTQFDNSTGVLNIITSWLDSLFYYKSDTYNKSEVYNKSETFNITGALDYVANNLCYSNGTNCISSGDNSSWNQSLADTLYYPITNPFNFYNLTNAPTYINDTWGSNQSNYYNKTFQCLSNGTNCISSNSGYTNLTQFVNQTPWRMFYTNNSGDVNELELGEFGTFLGGQGATSAPTWQIPNVAYVPYVGAIQYVDLGSENLNTSGNISSSYFIGNGSSLTSVCLSNGTNCQSSSSSMNYSNLALTNQSNNFIGNQNITGNLTVNIDGYIMGQPLLGMLGSGIIWINGTNTFAEPNITCVGLICSYPAFKVRLVNTSNVEKYCDMASGTFTLTDNQHSVIYLDNNCAVQQTSVQTFINTPLSPGGTADFANVIAENGGTYNTNGIGLENKRIIKLRKLLFQSTGKHLGIVSGFNYQLNTFPQINITTGEYVYLMDIVNTTKAVSATNKIEVLYHTSPTAWAGANQTQINITTCDTGTGITPCTTGLGSNTKYRRHFIFMIGYYDNGNDYTQLHQLLPSSSMFYSTLASCLDITANPLTYTLPTYYQYGAVPLYAYCARADDTAWTGAWIDLRTIKSGGSSTGGIDTSIFLTKDGSNVAQFLQINNTQGSTNAISAYGNSPNYFQLFIQNLNASASTDIATASSIGDSTNFFADMGITGPSFDDPMFNSITPPNTSYFIAGNSSITIGTGSNGKDIKFFVDSFTNPKWVLNLTNTSAFFNVNISAPNICYSNGTNCQSTGSSSMNYTNLALTNQSNNFIGNQNVSGNVTAIFFKGDGSLLSGIASGSINYTNICMLNQSNNFTTYNISAQYFIGDGSKLTNLTAQNINISGLEISYNGSDYIIPD